MKIGIAQTCSQKGAVIQNIQHHLHVIELAVASGVELIVFPELSITAYEPTLAQELAVKLEDQSLDPFQVLADQHKVVIGIGMPTLAIDGINISMILFQPQEDRLLYSKRILHADELPYFVKGHHQPLLQLKGHKISLGICYETLQRQHFVDAVSHGATIYIASVAKADRGVAKASVHFPTVACEFKIPILMSNSVGYCDNFLSNGQSSVWNRQGELIGQLDSLNQGLLIYDTDSEDVKSLLLP